MPNPNHNKREAPKRSHPPSNIKHPGRAVSLEVGPIKDVGFPGVPGKTQPRDRSNGIRKVKTRMRQEGL